MSLRGSVGDASERPAPRRLRCRPWRRARRGYRRPLL